MEREEKVHINIQLYNYLDNYSNVYTHCEISICNGGTGGTVGGAEGLAWDRSEKRTACKLWLVVLIHCT